MNNTLIKIIAIVMLLIVGATLGYAIKQAQNKSPLKIEDIKPECLK